MRQLINFGLVIYKQIISPVLHCLFSLTGQSCRFEPTCSDYFQQAVKTHGIIKGTLLGISRFARCHPFSQGGIDKVPKNLSKSNF